MEKNDSYYGELQKNIEKRSQGEIERKEQHGSSRIIFNREISPVQMYQNVMDNTTFIYKNRVLEEGKKVIFRLKGIRRKKIAGSIIQWLGALLFVLFVLYIFHYQSIEWDNNIKTAVALALFLGIPVFFFIGLCVRCSGRRFIREYLHRPSPFSDIGVPIIEFNRLANGQMVLMMYSRHDKSCGGYLSALNPDDTIWHGRGLGFKYVRIPTYVDYMYVIDSIKSCTRTENGLMIESSGRYYGVRGARHVGGGGDSNGTWLTVFAETHVSYRKEEILAIFSDMEQLEAAFMNYGYFEHGRDTFSPLT